MANTTITNLPLATSINGTEQIPAVQSSATVRLTVNQLVSFTSSTLPAPVVTIGGAVSGGTANNALYVSPSGTLGQFPYGTGVLNAIQIATGTNGAMVLLNGDAGTPTSLVLTNATGTPASIGLANGTGLPVGGISVTSGTPSASTFLRGDSTWAPIVLTVGTTAISGATNGYLLYNNGGTLGSVAPTAASLSIGSPITGGTSGYGLYVDASSQLAQFAYGTGVRTALGVNVGSAGAPVLFNGAGGQPTSINLTGATALSLPIGSISATGTPSASTYLRGDGSWAAAGGGGVTVNTGVTNQLSYYSGASAISGNDKATIIGGALTIGIQSNTAGSIVLANTNVAARSTTIQSSASASAAWTLTLPVSAGSSTNVLSTDGTGVTSWVAASVGTVTSVGLTVATGAGGILSNSGSTSPITGSGTYTLAVSGNSGGIPYFSSPSAWASSGTLTANGVVYGGGSGASPASTAVGTTGQVLIATTSNAPSWGQVPLATGVTGSLPIGNGGTGQATTALGTIVVGASGSTTTNLAIGTTGQILTVSGGTATWQNAASGGVSTITFGSTGLTPATATSGAVTVAGTLAAGSGGTGLATLTANSVLLGNGTSAVQLIAPSTAGNVLTSNGTTWASTAPAGGAINVYNVTASGTWTKPSGYAATSRVYIQVWGGGGGGAKATGTNLGGGGGGGGAYNERWMTLSELSATETVTVALGGAGATANATAAGIGGNTSFGTSAKITAYGGGGGNADFKGGGGGGLAAAAFNTNTQGGTPNGSNWTGGGGNQGINDCGSSSAGGGGFFGVYSGGAAGGIQSTNGTTFFAGAAGGNSVWGGGGGGGRGNAVVGSSGRGGTSQAAGAGGAAAVSAVTAGSNGSIPGGGGGGSGGGASAGSGGTGAIGQCIVTVFPA